MTGLSGKEFAVLPELAMPTSREFLHINRYQSAVALASLRRFNPISKLDRRECNSTDLPLDIPQSWNCGCGLALLTCCQCPRCFGQAAKKYRPDSARIGPVIIGVHVDYGDNHTLFENAGTRAIH
jgi:hypothetical protein